MRRLQYTALHKAVLEQRLSQIRLLLQQSNEEVNARDVNGRSPLMLSCVVGNERVARAMARLLLRAGADVTLKDAKGRTALALACIMNRESLVTLLAASDILDATEPDGDGRTPLHHAAECDNWRITSLLVLACNDNDADIDCRDRLGVTPLIEACRLGHFRCALHLLVDGQASVSIKDNVYFLNAYEWAIRAASLPPPLLPTCQQLQLQMLQLPTSLSLQREATQNGGAVFLTEQKSGLNRRLLRQRTLPSMSRSTSLSSRTGSLRSATTPAAGSSSRTGSADTLYVDVDEISRKEAWRLLLERMREQQQQQQQQQEEEQQRPSTRQLRSLRSSRTRRSNEVAGACHLLGLLHAAATAVPSAQPLPPATPTEAGDGDAAAAAAAAGHGEAPTLLQQQFTDRKSVSFKE